jgi:NADH-quinone oxidoreductase subunit F
MEKLSSIGQLAWLRNTILSRRQEGIIEVHVCMTGCRAYGAAGVLEALNEEVKTRGLARQVEVRSTGCHGFCAKAPVVAIEPMGVQYQEVAPDDAADIVGLTLKKNQLIDRLAYRVPKTFQPVYYRNQIPFYAKQERRVLANCGRIDHTKIEHYIAAGGYQALVKALSKMKPGQVIEEVQAARLRGRGGAGFPTALKWKFARQAEGRPKYVVCNADEGDPGAFMDRAILEGDPHAVLEGMLLGAYAMGSEYGYIYVREEYPIAVDHLKLAIEQAHALGLLGENILGTGFNFELSLRLGAGAFVCGEETALMMSIEGKRGSPRPRPPFPAIQGLWKRPTILNNVETLANIPQIILNGGKWYAGVGSQRSRGTKVFALTGDVRNVGLVEVPMGVPIGSIIFDVGGGIPNDKKFKAVQLGGPSGGCIPAAHLNAAVDYETIMSLGAIVGSGGMIVMDEDKCVVDVARFFMEFCRDESCGKCTPCRVGTQKMLEILTRICEGKGRAGDIETLEKWADIMKNTALCGLGQTAPNPVLSTLRYFREEYEAHIHEHRCPAVVCNAYFKSPCQHACPVGMDIPSYIALLKAGRMADAYKVLLRTNPFPGICGRVCDHQCETKCRRSTLDEPVHIKFLKRYITDHGPRPPVARVKPYRKEHIAVIGAGPSGLTAARDLVLRGYPVTVFEELPDAGGMLRWGIPAYRLPRDILQSEIQDILDLGVQLRCNTRIGRDISWDTVRNQYDALYVAVGAQRTVSVNYEGKNLIGVTGAVEFLRELHLGGRPYVGRRVAVVGGGNSAIDAAQCALRLGAEDVKLVYRRTRPEMPALKEEIETAEKEGVKMQFLVAPVRFQGDNGHVRRMICQRMALGEFDASGRKKALPSLGDTFEMEIDQVILAIGQEVSGALDMQKTGMSLGRGGLIEIAAGKKTETSVAMVFAGGDVVTGPGTVVAAIAAGHRAAADIDQAIRNRNGEPPYVPPVEQGIDIPKEIEEEIKEMARSGIPEADVMERIADFREIQLGFAAEAALREAGRCLRCDMQIES